MKYGFIKAASATPSVRVADTEYNAVQIISAMRKAAEAGAKILVLPELCLTGYTCGDLFLQDTLLDGAMDGLRTILKETSDLDMLTAVGMPVRNAGKLFNCAAVIQSGEVLAVIPKTHIPGYGEFSETRWFTGGCELGQFPYIGMPAPDGEIVYVPMGQTIIECDDVPGLKVGVEICEDLLVTDPPSRRLAEAGATVILNLSASPELAKKSGFRRDIVKAHSARLVCGYLMSGAGSGESTTDLVFCGHDIIAENGTVLAESRFENNVIFSDIDIQKLTFERRRMNTFGVYTTASDGPTAPICRAWAEFSDCDDAPLTRKIEKSPFVPSDSAELNDRCEEILTVQALGLKKRMEHTRSKNMVIGVSGGLDSTLAMLVAARTTGMMGLPRSSVLAVTMPCFGTTARTKSNAVLLAESLGASLRTVDIGESVMSHFKDIGHDFDDHSVVFENAQARERTQVLMDIANESGSMVIGTGDLSELALGWATYNGDHMSMYGVNADIPKTLIRHLVRWCADNCGDEKLSSVLSDILATPVSPELLPAENGEISQKTEDIVGPYELHDFFLYYFVRWGFSPEKILFLAENAFAGVYEKSVIQKWLRTFVKRFFSQQFKRSCLPDGPKIGSVGLSPRGDWKMPSDACVQLWLNSLEDEK